MENLYTPSPLLTAAQFETILRCFEQSWNTDTAHSGSQYQYSPDNTASGQCAPTALIVNDLLGGKLLYDRSNHHVWNELPDGTQQDFSRSQFQEKRSFDAYESLSREEFLADAEGSDLLERYEILKERFDGCHHPQNPLLSF